MRLPEDDGVSVRTLQNKDYKIKGDIDLTLIMKNLTVLPSSAIKLEPERERALSFSGICKPASRNQRRTMYLQADAESSIQ